MEKIIEDLEVEIIVNKKIVESDDNITSLSIEEYDIANQYLDDLEIALFLIKRANKKLIFIK